MGWGNKLPNAAQLEAKKRAHTKRMEIRRDPITQSWVVLGHREAGDETDCPFEKPAIDKQQTILSWPAEGPWQVRVVPHPDPLYRIAGEAGRRADGIYGTIGPVGAHEVV